MLKDLTPEQRALAHYMSELSEEAYCAGWMSGLEYGLWKVMVGRSKTYGLLRLKAAELAKLRDLAEQCGGWIVFDDTTEKTWLPMPEWKRRFKEWVKRGRPAAG